MRALGAGLLILLAGCAAMPQASPAFQAVSTEKASMRWQRQSKVLVCDGYFSRAANGAARLRLGDTPVLVDLILSPPNQLAAHGSLMRHGWKGTTQDAPPTLAALGTFLSVYQHAKELPPGEKEIHTMADRIVYSITPNGRMKSLSVLSNDTGEIISGTFEP